MKALILNDKVVQLEETEFPVNENLQWMDAPIGCEVGWVLQNGELVEPAKEQLTQEEKVQLYATTMQQHIDTKAMEKNYDNGFSCATYANSTNTDWKAEADAFIAFRDDCWQYAIDVQTQVENNEIESPTVEEFIANAPVLNWS